MQTSSWTRGFQKQSEPHLLGMQRGLLPASPSPGSRARSLVVLLSNGVRSGVKATSRTSRCLWGPPLRYRGSRAATLRSPASSLPMGRPRNVAGQAALKATGSPGAGGQGAQGKVSGHKDNTSNDGQSGNREAKKKANYIRKRL